MYDYDFNDTVSSWYCGKSIQYDFCKDKPEDDCTHMNGQKGAGTARNPQMGHNDSLSTLKLRPYDGATQGAVVVFGDMTCEANTGRFFANSDPTRYADYSTADIEYHNT